MSGTATPNPSPEPTPVVERRIKVDATLPATWLVAAILYVVTTSFVFGGAWMSTQARLTAIENVQSDSKAARQIEDSKIQELDRTLDILQANSNNEAAIVKDMSAKIDKNTDLLQNLLHIGDFPAAKARFH